MSKELGDLHKVGLRGVSANEIVIYIAKKVIDKSGKELNGCAAINSNRPAVVVSSTGSPWTLGHELAHVLLETYRPVHSTYTGNLMYAPSASISSNPATLDVKQLEAIRKSKFVSSY